MNLQAYRKISPGLNAEITAVLAKYNLKVSKQSASIDERCGIVNLRIVANDVDHKDATGAATTPERELFKQYHSIYDLKIEWLDAKFSLGRETYRLAGLRNSRSAKAVLIERLSDHSMRVCEPDIVRNAIVAGEKR